MRLGEHDIASDEDGAEPVDYQVQEALIHAGYHSRYFSHK